MQTFGITVSMLNSAYKLFTSGLNNRIVELLDEVIGSHQTGFLPGRRMIPDHGSQKLLRRCDLGGVSESTSVSLSKDMRWEMP